MELPEEERYDGYLQLENGVGMIRLLLTEFDDALELHKKELSKLKYKNNAQYKNKTQYQDNTHKTFSVVTGLLPYDYIKQMCEKIEALYPNININIYPIVNNFFGEMITVSGLLTGQDIKAQLQGKDLGDYLLLPQNVLRSGENIFLDDMTLEELQNALQVPINIVKSSGYDFFNAFVELI